MSVEMIYFCVCVSILIFLIIVVYWYSSKNKRNEIRETNKILIVVSFFKLTLTQMDRFISIGKLLPSGYKLVYVTENCNYIEELKPFQVFCFTRNDFQREFPSYKNMTGYCRNQQDGFYMWSMWLESVLHSIKGIYLNYKYIWIIEGDVGYSGDINMFFRKYDNVYSDLLSLPTRIVNNISDWCWYDCYTYEYMKWIKSKTPVERIITGINVVRLSPILIHTVMLNLKLNRHSHCESTLHETAKYNNLIINILNKSNLGERIGVNDRVSLDDWKIFNSDPLKQNKLYHALKF